MNPLIAAHQTRRRSLLKTLSWRVVGSLDTLFLSWLLTGHFSLACAIGGAEVFTKTALYYFHERAWNRVDWGRE